MAPTLTLQPTWEALADSVFSHVLRESIWIYPALETVHVLGLALLFGTIAAFDLRVLGWTSSLSVADLWQHLKIWIWLGFAATFTSGILLFTADAAEFAINPALQIKLLLLAVAGANALYFEMYARPAAEATATGSAEPFGARVSAALSLTLWLAIVVAGRMIAYIK